MTMFDDDFRVLAVVRFEVGSGDPPSQHAALEAASWLVVDAFRNGGLYVSVTSYPRWTNTEEMRDFGLIHPIFPVNGLDCFCLQLQPSPIAESFVEPTSLSEVSPDCMNIVLRNPAVDMTAAGTWQRVCADEQWSACRNDFERAGFTRSMRQVWNLDGLKDGILVLSTGVMPPLLPAADFTHNLFSFWANLVSPEPMETGFIFQGGSGRKS